MPTSAFSAGDFGGPSGSPANGKSAHRLIGKRETTMKRGMGILLSVCVLAAAGYFTASKLAIRHKTLTLYDPMRTDRPVEVDISVRRDREIDSLAEMVT